MERPTVTRPSRRNPEFGEENWSASVSLHFKMLRLRRTSVRKRGSSARSFESAPRQGSLNSGLRRPISNLLKHKVFPPMSVHRSIRRHGPGLGKMSVPFPVTVSARSARVLRCLRSNVGAEATAPDSAGGREGQPRRSPLRRQGGSQSGVFMLAAG